MKKPSPAKIAARSRKLEAKRERTREYTQADRVLTTGIAIVCLMIGTVIGLAAASYFYSAMS